MSPINLSQILLEPEKLTASLENYALSYAQWLERQMSKGKLLANVPMPAGQRKALLADWLILST